MESAYVVITPARNEEAHIELTIKSMIAQTIRPLRWVVVSDGSTDRTGEIVATYLSDHPWIELLELPPRETRDFAAKVHAFNAGFARVEDLEYAFLANIDGDISFGRDHFEFLLTKFAEHPRLGLAGTKIVEPSYDSFRDSHFNDADVPGACQVFRREAFADTGGYKPIRMGGVDWAIVRRVRMAGWQTTAFPEREFFHYRPMGTAGGNVWTARFIYGRRDYRFGNHPLWELLRLSYQCTRRPYVIAGLCLTAGYLWSMLKMESLVIPQDLRDFNRREQLSRLRQIFHLGNSLGGGAPLKSKKEEDNVCHEYRD